MRTLYARRSPGAATVILIRVGNVVVFVVDHVDSCHLLAVASPSWWLEENSPPSPPISRYEREREGTRVVTVVCRVVAALDTMGVQRDGGLQRRSRWQP